MTFNAASATALFSALRSDALSLKVFDAVGNHEPTAQPGKGLYLSLTLASIEPMPAASGMAATSGKVVISAKIWANATTRARRLPLDELDPEVLGAAASLMAIFSGGFTLGGTVRDVDLMSMTAAAVWVDFGGGTEYRVIDITVPVIINDLFEQEP